MGNAEQEGANAQFMGPHRVWAEEPDAVFVVWNGDVLAEHIVGLDSSFAKLMDNGPTLVMVQDVRKLGKFTPAARNKIIEKKESQRLTLVVLIAASFHTRVLLNMIHRAMYVLHKATTRLTFCDTYDAARKIIQAHRREMLEKQK